MSKNDPAELIIAELRRQQQLALRPGVDSSVISAFSDAKGVDLPEEFRHFYSRVDGMPEPIQVPQGFLRIYPLNEWHPVSEWAPGLSSSKTCYVFADWWYAANCLGVELAPGSQYGRIWSFVASPIRVADSLGEFVELLLSGRLAAVA